jgi:hypothetical protein
MQSAGNTEKYQALTLIQALRPWILRHPYASLGFLITAPLQPYTVFVAVV